MASGHVNRTTGRTHGCSDHCCTREETVDNPEPSTHGLWPDIMGWYFISLELQREPVFVANALRLNETRCALVRERRSESTRDASDRSSFCST